MKRTHVAIMRKSWGLTAKILSGEKTIESRWYKNRYKPWGQIAAGDIVYFKDSGEPVTIKTTVSKVLQLDGLTPKKVKKLLNKYAKADGLGMEKKKINRYYHLFKNKKYCLIIFLKKPQKIKPFDIDKTGFGAMASWLIIDKINNYKKRMI
jgi:ASC-1-like (ASCH) protein